MDPAKILDEFTHAEGLPKAALRAATEQQAAMVPLFLADIEGYLAHAPDERAKPTPLFFIFHLLGEWREKSVAPCRKRPAPVDASVKTDLTTQGVRDALHDDAQV